MVSCSSPWAAFCATISDQLSLLSALGDVKLNRSPPLGSEPRLYRLHVVGEALEEYPARDVWVGGVELLEEGGYDLGGFVAFGAVHEEVLAPDQLSLPYEERLDPGVASALGECDDVYVLVGEAQHLLALVHLFDGDYLVSEDGGTLEFVVFGRLLHAGADALYDLVGLALEEQRDLVNNLVVALPVHLADAGGYAAVDVVVEAGAVVVAGDGLGA